MIIYNSTKKEFLEDVDNGKIAKKIESGLLDKMGRRTSRSEYRSWENSMLYMHRTLADKEIPDGAGIAVEYNIPHTSKRADFLISGYGLNNAPAVIIIELKQWETINAVEDSDSLVETYTGGAVRTVVHPSYQAWSYASSIENYNQYVQDEKIKLVPCAFLHNYILRDDDPVISEKYESYIADAPVFTKGDIIKMRGFIKKYIAEGDNCDIIYKIDSSPVKPSRKLQDTIGSMIEGNKEFIMLDEQQVVYEKILNCSINALNNNKKYTVIVEGGPGTGKSVIAVNLLAALTQKEIFAQYVSKNSAPRTVYQQRLKGIHKKSVIDLMFSGSGVYTEALENKVDAVIVDEAHRLNAKSGIFHNKGENQIKEIIHASKCSAFFIDERQRVTLSDIGSVSEIEKYAVQEGAEIIKMQLVSQFRCNGSDGYPAWIDNTLQIRETANISMKDIDYDVRIVESAEELRKLIVEKNAENHRSRILAGYCWDWNKAEQNNTDYYDIEIGEFRMSWNLGSSIFAIDDSSINEVGCIHTSQGLEFDHVGVIIGEDMRYENGRIVTDFNMRAKTDQSLKGIKKLYKENPTEAVNTADEIIKNTYRTLMTRGMKGCYIYCVDENLAEYLRSRLRK